MRNLMLLLLTASIEVGCANSVVLNRGDYKNQLRFFERSLDLAKGRVLEARAAAIRGDIGACTAIADQALVLDAHGSYQIALARWAIDEGPDPGDAPNVPAAADWCAIQATAKPAENDDPNHPALPR